METPPNTIIGGTAVTIDTTVSQSLFTPAPSGAFVKVLRTEREMKTYAFTDGELSTIGMFSGILNIAVAGASAVLGALLSGGATTTPAVLRYVGLIVGFLVAGIWAAWRRGSEVDRVKQESKTVTG